jgi:hypothetical protein
MSLPHSIADNVVRRAKAEFFDMPGLRLTEAQARRLWDLNAESCASLLDALIEARFLVRTFDGKFMRVESIVPGSLGVAKHRTKNSSTDRPRAQRVSDH